MTRDERLNLAVEVLSKKEPYFATRYKAARALLNSATFGADVVKFPNGVVATLTSCNVCGSHTVCLHRDGVRLYTYEEVQHEQGASAR